MKDACPPVQRAAAVILAAGESRRFGESKLRATLHGRPLVQHAIDAADASSCADVILVVGHRADELLDAARPGRARIVPNPEYAAGQSTSLRAGIRAAGDADAVVVLLADQPGVTAALIDALVERQRTSGAAAVICAHEGRRSPPTLLHRSLWPALESLKGDVGAREILAGREDVAVLEVTPDLGRLEDIDEREDLARLDRPT